EELGRMVYVRPDEAEPAVADAIAPQGHLSITSSNKPLCGIPRLAPSVDSSATALAWLTLPYRYPAAGSVKDHAWASIHSSPPWEDTDHPVVVTNRFGDGRSVYCVSDIETTDAEAHERLFVRLIASLLPHDGARSFTVDTHPAIWANAFDQSDSDRGRLVASFLNYQAELPPVAVPVSFRLRPPAGKTFTGLTAAPSGDPLPYEVGADGSIPGRLA